jgi:hypothetical protein
MMGERERKHDMKRIPRMGKTEKRKKKKRLSWYGEERN